MDGSRINHHGTESTDKVCCGTACVQEWQPPTQGGGFGREKHLRLVHLVPHFINTATFATRDFWPRRGASDAHTLQGSVRSEQRRRGQKEPSPGGLRRFFGSGFVAPRSQPHFGGCSLVAPRQNRKATQQTRSYL